MRVIICGADKVGASIAAYLAREENDVTVIDPSEELVSQINDTMDVNAIAGKPSNPEVLKNAGANEADMIIAVTTSDETNMISCQIAHSLFGVPKKIARIRDQSFLDPVWSNLFSRSHMPIDVIISPETLIAEDIFRRISVPGTTSVISMADERLYLIGVICAEDCPVINTQLSQLKNLFPDLSFGVVSITRQNRHIIPDGDDMLEVGDEAYIIVDTRHLRRVMAAFGHLEKEARKIIVSGGGNIGYSFIKLIKSRLSGIQIKVIEQNTERANFLSEKLEDIIILNGDTLDRALLEEAAIDKSEAYIALMNDDESNILGSLLAKQYGCERVLTLVNNNAYYPLVGPLGVDVMISPRATLVSHIMQHVRRGRIRGIYNVRDGFAEAIEAEASDSSFVVNKKISDLELPREITFAAVVRGENIIIPDGNTEIRKGDIAIVWAQGEKAHIVEKLFSVSANML
ncbi:MAG: Trk system potassium transporter TrkA [Alphaproteobacteria bacterium]|nr:Trk system potassium transporter TrkA [Alphaproteobacteria bacterium]